MHKCELCGRTFESTRGLFGHVTQKHKITTKDYYDTYLKKSNEGFCVVCGKPTAFYGGGGYLKHCSIRCGALDPEAQRKLERTNIERYGSARPTGFNSDKFKSTIKNKYGVDNIAQSSIIMEKIKQTSIERYGGHGWASKELLLKCQKTNLERYGAVNAQGGIGLEHTKETLMKHFGVTSAAQASEVRRKVRNNKKQKGTLSKIEQYFEEKLQQLNIEYETEYKSDAYPYFCDFYLNDYDMYIEINNFWVHGKHFFDEKDPNDIATLNKWKSKSSKGYESAIYIWTVLDIEKRNCALNNNLNYIVLWNIDDIDNFIVELSKKVGN